MKFTSEMNRAVSELLDECKEFTVRQVLVASKNKGLKRKWLPVFFRVCSQLGLDSRSITD